MKTIYWILYRVLGMSIRPLDKLTSLLDRVAPIKVDAEGNRFFPMLVLYLIIYTDRLGVRCRK